MQQNGTGETTLLLIRHGHVAHNSGGADRRLCGWYDAPLSALGRSEARLLRARLAGEVGIEALYSSPSRRARDTAAEVAATIGVPGRLLRSLREINCGMLEGLPLERVRALHPELWARNLAQSDPDFRWPGGESYRELRARALGAIRQIAAAHPAGQVAIVTHSGVITQVLGALFGAGPARWGAFRVGNASITELRWAGDGGRLMRLDDRRHLAAAV